MTSGVQDNYCTSLISPSTHTPHITHHTHLHMHTPHITHIYTCTTPPPLTHTHTPLHTHTAPSPPTVSGPREVFAGETTQLNCSSSVSNVFTLRWVRVGRLTLPSSATQVGNNLVFTNPLSTDTGTYSCISISTGVSANITISFLTPSTEGLLFQLPAY